MVIGKPQLGQDVLSVAAWPVSSAGRSISSGNCDLSHLGAAPGRSPEIYGTNGPWRMLGSFLAGLAPRAGRRGAAVTASKGARKGMDASRCAPKAKPPIGNAPIGFVNGGTFPRRPRCCNAHACTGRLMQNAITVLPIAAGRSKTTGQAPGNERREPNRDTEEKK
jgi:hypothetical protein